MMYNNQVFKQKVYYCPRCGRPLSWDYALDPESPLWERANDFFVVICQDCNRALWMEAINDEEYEE